MELALKPHDAPTRVSESEKNNVVHISALAGLEKTLKTTSSMQMKDIAY